MCSYSFWLSTFLCIDLDFHLVWFLSPWRISFNIFCGLNLLMVNSSNFCMPEKKSLFHLCFWKIFAMCRNSRLTVFSFQYLKDGVHCLSSMFSDEKSFILIFVILYITGLLFSHSFSDFSLYDGFWVIWFIICVILIFFIYFVLRFCWPSWICEFKVFIKFGKVSGHYSYFFSVLLSFKDSNYLYIRPFEVVPPLTDALFNILDSFFFFHYWF